MIRPARLDELDALRVIERRAGMLFATSGMAAVAEDEPRPVDELAVYQRDGRVWVATDEQERAVGYVLVEVVDRAAHVEQLSVDPDHGRRGLGGALLDAVDGWARDRGLGALTLTTFRDVAWNGPYYRRLGFQAVPEDQQGEGLRRVRRDEQAKGLDEWPRVAMRRPVACK